MVLAAACLVAARAAAQGRDPFEGFAVPEAWEARFWATEEARAVLAMEPKAVADLVPAQAGLRYCRCPACGAGEAEDPLTWSPARPAVVRCKACGAEVPNDTYPAKVPPAPGQPPAVPEEVVEVRPRVLHRYPYHPLDPVKQAYPDERLYLAAKRDYEAKEALAKVALYAALRSRRAESLGRSDPVAARLAAVIVLRFAQVYPSYATHFDQPGQPKYLGPADQPPPYRSGYRTGKWDWSGCLDVPMNLVIAYALVRDHPALAEAGALLGEPSPRRAIEEDLFRASARFVRAQPEEYNESSIYAYRGLIAVGRLLGDDDLVREGLSRLDGFAERGFSFDGFWKLGDPEAHRRVVALVDGWIERLLDGYEPRRGASRTSAAPPGSIAGPLLELARRASDAAVVEPSTPVLQRVAWPAVPSPTGPRRPMLLGGSGLARLAVGEGDRALDLELRDQGDGGSGHGHRLTLRLAVGGHVVLGDLDGEPPGARGFERSALAHNTVVVDGLDHRESIEAARRPAPGGDVLFFAADPDFQVATLEDRHCYPSSTTRLRQTVLACDGPSPYAVSVVEVQGGLQHDQVYGAPGGSPARWGVSARLEPGPASLLPETIRFLPGATAEDGRWFVQSYGEFGGLASARLEKPGQAALSGGRGPGVRLHLLGDLPAWVVSGVSTDPPGGAPPRGGPGSASGRAGLVVRRHSEDGTPLRTVFVTVFEPLVAGAGLRRVGRIEAPEGVVALAVETAGGTDQIVLNLAPGVEREIPLLDGRALRTDGLAVRVRAGDLTLAGGGFAEAGGLRVEQSRASGTIRASGRSGPLAPGALGWFETDGPIVEPASLAGRTLVVRHADGTSRGWTIARAENTDGGVGRIEVRELPGFRVESPGGEAAYTQFPGLRAPGPHRFGVGKIARTGSARADPRSDPH
jgi:hypothetical protein